MGAVAELCKSAGHEVRGSDEHVYPPMSTQLAAAGIPLFSGFGDGNLEWGPDVVVVGNVCRKDHVEVLAAERRGIRLASFPSILEEQLLKDPQPPRPNIVIAGTHGKTTTTSLSAWVLRQAGRDPSYMVGGVPINMGRGAALGKGPFVLEGDEYDTAFFDKKSKFLHYCPTFAVITAVELDHVDIFSGLDAIKASFREFVSLLPEHGALLVGASSPAAVEVAAAARCRVERYAVGPVGPSCPRDVEWRAEITGTRTGGRTLFDVFYRGNRLGSFDTGLPGHYNLENALSVIGIMTHLGLSPAEIARGIRLFAGVKRRQELRGLAQGVAVVDDFAHHPTAVRETLRGLRGRHGSGRLFAVMEPRSATSRTAVFQKEFAEALALADEVVVSAVHMPEKAPSGNRLDVELLATDVRKHGVPAKALPGVSDIVDYLAPRVAAGDTVVVMSSGSFDGLHDRLLARLGDGVVQGTAEDIPGVLALLEHVGLPKTGIPDELSELWVIRGNDKDVVGCVALEIYGETALLRSLAVNPDRRGEGLGWMLAEMVQLRVRQRGLTHVFLLTEHATDFFAEKFGFRPISRDSLPEDVKSSSEYRRNQTERSVAMSLPL
jgi:UDP-N-acetylmuramate: L-alanyl-gamma-D-glutamyl-meso-diaminopimelate ligase